jgi:glycerol-3-phosphate dehydrogenase
MQLRDRNIRKLPETTYDVLIIGGGINGAVAAAALAGKGAQVALIDRGDFAGFTSQQSSNLVWGGIKYLETFEFLLVRNLCRSRNRLLQSYPAAVQEIRFLTTIDRGFRHHPVKLWLGAWLYWCIGNGFTRIPRLFSPRQMQREEALINVEKCVGGIEYSDAYLPDNDARFVFNFIRAALNRGCVAANYVESLGARREHDGTWTTQVRDVLHRGEFAIRSRVLINATGPFVDEHNRRSGQTTEHQHVLSKGIHLLVPRLTPHHRVLAFFADDGRLFFAIPMGTKTCIGTTDTPVTDPFATMTEADRQFVLDNINARLHLPQPLGTGDIIAERCGVRPLAVKKGAQLQRDFLQLSRHHVIEVNRQEAHISIFGGKLTDCLNVGEEVCSAVKELGIALPYADYIWYGEPPAAIKAEFLHQARLLHLDRYTAPEASEPLSARLWRRYGAEAIGLLEALREDARQAEVLISGADYIRCELQHATRREMIVKLEDFLRRRSNIALLTRSKDIRQAPALLETCEILFGEQAQEKYNEYFQVGEPATSHPH